MCERTRKHVEGQGGCTSASAERLGEGAWLRETYFNATFPASFPSDFLGKPTRKVTNVIM